MSSLAKKAVAGDEKALDIFSAWRPKTGSYRPTFTTDNLSCYVAVFPGTYFIFTHIYNLFIGTESLSERKYRTVSKFYITISVNYLVLSCEGVNEVDNVK